MMSTSIDSQTRTLYKPFNDKADSIRLIKPSGHDMQEYFLSVHLLSHCPSYYALSYLWGPITPTRDIRVNGEGLQIRQNLFDALLSIGYFLFHERHGKEPFSDTEPDEASKNPHICTCELCRRPRFFWIDAICIDQTNTEEKNAQVALMPEIYSNANKVIVWLGPRGLNSDLAVETLKIPEGRQLSNLSFSPLFVKEPFETNGWRETDGRFGGGVEARRTAILDLSKRPYWQRVWIVQEVLKARQLIFLCGDQSFSWKHADQLLADAERASSAMETSWLYKAFSATPAAKLLKWKRQWERMRYPSGLDPSFPLDKLMEDFANRGSQDPRDRVFALLALSRPAEHLAHLASGQFLPIADYSRSKESVFADVMTYICDMPHRKDLLDLWKFVMLVQWNLEVDDSHEQVQSAKLEVVRRNIDSSVFSAGITTSFVEIYAEALYWMKQCPEDSNVIKDFAAFFPGINNDLEI
jgi:hypothetical protein